MGCQCMEKKDIENEIKKEGEGEGEGFDDQGNNYVNVENGEGMNDGQDFGLQKDQDGFNQGNFNQNNFDQGNSAQDNYKERQQLNDDLNIKYADYPQRMLELINQIRADPGRYASVIEESIKNIETIPAASDNDKPKIIYKQKVKVALFRGEEAFLEAADKLRLLDPLPPLEFKEELQIPLPQTENDIKDSSYLKNRVKELREQVQVDIFFKDLIKKPEVSALLMIVDDGGKNPGRKRDAVLNKDFKYIGINSKFIDTTFVAYFAFSK